MYHFDVVEMLVTEVSFVSCQMLALLPIRGCVRVDSGEVRGGFKIGDAIQDPAGSLVRIKPVLIGQSSPSRTHHQASANRDPTKYQPIHFIKTCASTTSSFDFAHSAELARAPSCLRYMHSL